MATTGFRLAAACGVGVVAAAGDWLAFRVRAGLQAAAPALALFVTCCIFGATRGRWWAVFLIVAATLAFWLAHRVLLVQARVVWFANLTGDATASTVAIGAAAAAAALLAALVVTPTLPSTEGQGVLGWRHGIGGVGGNRSVPTPIADLHTKLIQKSTQPAFTVRSPVPSYWRLTSLDTFTGQQWQSTDSYAGANGRLPGQPDLPARSIQSDFHIQNLDSIWMPTAFNPTAVSGGGQVSWDPVSDSLLASKATSNGLNYRLTSYQYLASLNPVQLDAAGPAPTAGMRPYLALPSSVPAGVVRLAASIVSSAHTEYQKAKALQDYFQGPQFHYSLNPPDDGYGIDALSVFLFTTQTGYCQQFAGAYAVLARAVGLPTRLAVGFATGSPDSNGTYHVLDGDAHTWPEVYFKGFGWL
ncbi:MAG: transglutaminaseTgpA domain-containing protein, partial [Acidimicrobiales bacterium]